jgi:predicted secreted protein
MEGSMRSRLLLPAIALGLAASICSAALAADPASSPTAETGTEIHLVQQVEREVPRDRLHASLRVEAEGTDPAKVQAEVNRLMGEALANAKRETSVKPETAGYSIYQEPRNDKDRAAPAKWHASQSITLAGKDFAAALALVGELQASGLLLEGLSFDLAPETLRGVQDEMTTQALAGLRARADHVAGDLGMKVERYKSIEVGNATTGGSRPMPMLGRSMATSAAPMPPPAAEAGDSTVSLTVDAQVIMAPAKAP